MEAWFTLKDNTTGELRTIPLEDDGSGDCIHEIVDLAIESNSVVVAGPLKVNPEPTAKEHLEQIEYLWLFCQTKAWYEE